jgi:hypothetical protein
MYLIELMELIELIELVKLLKLLELVKLLELLELGESDLIWVGRFPNHSHTAIMQGLIEPLNQRLGSR